MKAPSTEQLVEQNGKSNTYDCVISVIVTLCWLQFAHRLNSWLWSIDKFYSPVLCDVVSS